MLRQRDKEPHKTQIKHKELNETRAERLYGWNHEGPCAAFKSGFSPANCSLWLMERGRVRNLHIISSFPGKDLSVSPISHEHRKAETQRHVKIIQWYIPPLRNYSIPSIVINPDVCLYE